MTTENETPAESEIDILAADPTLLLLPASDITIRVEKLKTRQLFKFLKILTVGAGPLLSELQLSADTKPEDLQQDIIALLLISIPEADNEVIDFLKSMVKPVDLIEPERTQTDHKINVSRYEELFDLLDNPEPADSIALLVHIVKAEAPNMLALGKQVAALLPSAAKLTTSSKKPSKK